MKSSISNFETNKLSIKKMAKLNGGMTPGITEVGTAVDADTAKRNGQGKKQKH
ncbi:MAG: hypothetical protein AAFX87_09310 [Bacteroidota bacterium]